MAEEVKHIIRRVALEVETGSGDAEAAGGAFRFQDEAVAWAQDSLLPGLEAVFSSLPAAEAHILLDRLEITVDARDREAWGREVLPRLKEELRGILVRKLREGGPAPGETRESPAESFFRKLAGYLEHGVLPWNLVAATPADLAAQAEAWLSMPGAAENAPELAVLWRLPSARARFLRTLPAPLMARLLIRFYRMPEHLVAAWSRDASRLRRPASPSGPAPGLRTAHLPQDLLEEILLALSRSPRLFEHGLEEEIIAAYLHRLLEEGRIPLREASSIPFESVAFLNSRQRLSRSVPSPRPLRPPMDPSPATAARPAPAPSADPHPLVAVTTQPEAGTEDPALAGIHIPNAGLILLAPFLSMLFERLDLSDKASLKDPATILALLHFLATGEEAPAEFQLPLAKVLCGLPLEKAISLPMSLPEPVKAEGRRMLASVIGHWGILKNTSVEGLRESFLQRPGKLTRTARDWLLQVEQKPYDMLLQSLPWGFQVIRLPWMKQVLRTEWVE